MATRGKGDTTAQVARQRERAKLQEANTGIKASASSSGIPSLMAMVHKRTWEEIADKAQHVTDLVCYVSDLRKTAAGSWVSTLHIPIEYQHDLVDLADMTRFGFTMMRCYLVRRPDFMDLDTPETPDDAA